jgi:uncharacterized protein with PIN domain
MAAALRRLSPRKGVETRRRPVEAEDRPRMHHSKGPDGGGKASHQPLRVGVPRIDLPASTSASYRPSPSERPRSPLARIRQLPIELATTLVDKLLPEIGALIIPVDGAIALDAFARFGKGRRPAALNMGDCFAYACAKARGQPLLCKGDDFGRTDALLA